MSSPDLHGDESVILTTPDVFIKSIPFEAVLTNKRIILIDRDNDLVPQKDIVLTTIRDVQPGENAVHDQTVSLSVVATAGGTRQIVLTFPAKTGGKRKRERDEWVTALQKHTRSSFQKAIHNVIPGLDKTKPAKSRDSSLTTLPYKKSVDAAGPQKKAETAIPAAHVPVRAAAIPESLFCTRCGNHVPSGSLFCTRCGGKIVVQEQAPGQPDAHADAGPKTRPATPDGRALQAKKKSPFALPHLFRKKKRQPEPGPRATPSRRGRSGGFGKYVTIIAIFAVIILAVAGGAFVFMNFQNLTPSASGGSPTGQKSVTPTPTFVFVEKTAVPIPEKGVWVRVSYLGMWSGSYGTADALESVTGSGEYLYEIANPTKTIQATFKRADTSTRPHELVVGIYKNGALIKQGVTTIPGGSVDIAVDPDTAKPISNQTTGK